MYVRVKEGGAIDAAKPVLEGLSPEQQAALVAALGGQPGDLLLLAAGPAGAVNKALDRVRQYLARSLDLIQASAAAFESCILSRLWACLQRRLPGRARRPACPPLSCLLPVSSVTARDAGGPALAAVDRGFPHV